MKIELAKLIGENCLALNDGQRLFQIIFPEIKNGTTVVLDFTNVKKLLTPFLRESLGKLFKYFSKETILQRINFSNITPEDLQRINLFIDSEDRLDTSKLNRATLEDAFDEDIITDDGSSY